VSPDRTRDAAPEPAVERMAEAGAEPELAEALGPGPRVAIVGLGPMGIALGRALAAVRTSYRVVGHDPLPERAGAAKASGAFDRLDWNLVRTVERADLVFLAEPLDDALATLAAIGPHLKAGALVTDTAAIKVPMMAAARALPAGIAFIGGHPVVDPVAAAADPAVFGGAAYCLMPAPSAGEQTLRVLGDFVRAIGAEPFYIDPEEHDALMVGSNVLPGLVADALLRVVAGSPSADDLRRLAGPSLHALAAATPPDAGLAETARSAALVWLDQLLADLSELRDALADEPPEARSALAERAAAARGRWLAAREDPLARSARAALDQRSGIRDVLFGRLGRRRT